MNKSNLAITLGISMLALLTFSCKDEKKVDEVTEKQSTEQSATPETSQPTTEKRNEPKTYSVSFSPDTVYLGKNKEAFIKLKDVKAVELSDPDGKVTGIELSYILELTNKKPIKESSVYINPNDFRLVLDNGNSITHHDYHTVTAEAESTKASEENSFRIPAGAKPKMLNLYFDETRASVNVEVK